MTNQTEPAEDPQPAAAGAGPTTVPEGAAVGDGDSTAEHAAAGEEGDEATATGEAPAGPGAVSPFAGIPVSDYVRDGVAALLLLVSLALPWDAANRASDKIEVVLQTILSLLTLALPYLARTGVLPATWTVHTTRKVRLLANAPYVLLVGVDAATGSELWSLPGTGVRAVARVDGRVVVQTDSTYRSVDARTGEEAWAVELDDDGPGPVLTDGRSIYVTERSRGGPGLVSIALDDGAVEWRWALPEDTFHVVAVEGRLFLLGADRLTAVS